MSKKLRTGTIAVLSAITAALSFISMMRIIYRYVIQLSTNLTFGFDYKTLGMLMICLALVLFIAKLLEKDDEEYFQKLINEKRKGIAMKEITMLLDDIKRLEERNNNRKGHK